MSAINYRIWSGPVARASHSDDPTILFDVGLHAKAKRNRFSDYEIANEMISLRLGQSIGLPIPSGVPLEMNGERYFSSLIGASMGECLPPGDAKAAAKMDPQTVCGAVLFDAWICNMDRHCQNFHFDEEDGRLYLFDHGNALFGANGKSRLDEHAGRLAIVAAMHGLAKEMRDLSSFDAWEGKILELPKFLIREAVFSADQEGIDKGELDRCYEFLLTRRKELRALVADAQDDPTVFPSIKATLFRVEKNNDQQPEYYI